jgi:hypothetical protein
MNCSRAREWIPLHAGADLATRKAGRLERHLQKCANCRAEFKEHRAALDAVRAAAGREALDWPEGEWKTLLARATSGRPGSNRFSPLVAFPKKAWAYGLAALFLLSITALILRSLFSPPAVSLLSEMIAATPAPPSRSLPRETAASAAPARDVPFQIQREQGSLDGTTLAARTAAGEPAQDILCLTLVSQETGLKVHWTFHRNFEWEEKR